MNTIYSRINSMFQINNLRDLYHFSNIELLSLQILQMCFWFADVAGIFCTNDLQLCCALKVSPKTINVIGRLVLIETTPMISLILQFKKQETITFNKLWKILIAHICMGVHTHSHTYTYRSFTFEYKYLDWRYLLNFLQRKPTERARA